MEKKCIRLTSSFIIKGPIHDCDLQSQPQFPTATSTKFPVYGLQQPQLAGRCCVCCWSEFSDIWWAIWSSKARSDIVTIKELRFNWERLNRSVAACVGRPSTATAIWLHIAVAIENRCRGWGPLELSTISLHLAISTANSEKITSCQVLKNLTSQVNNLSYQSYITGVFNKLEDRQKQCIILVDEIYVKRSLLYHGGQLFGKAHNNEDELANAMLEIMIKCQFGGPSFLFKIVPVICMTAEFLYEHVKATLALIHNASGVPITIIADGNRTNQKFFNMFETIPGKPWLTTDGLFLLYDFAHLIKNIRNNCLTETVETMRERIYNAKWSHLVKLYQLELIETRTTNGIHGLSSLNEVAVRPKPVERQNVSNFIRIFSDETLHALKVHPGLDQQEVKGMITFVQTVNTMWKILNVRSRNKDVIRNDQKMAGVRK